MSLTDGYTSRKRWRAATIALACIGVFVAATVVAAVWLGPESNDTRVIEDWNSTISKLGIDPVFPPEEDVEVGDIYAVLNDHPQQRSSQTALALRSIKIFHQNLTSDIEEVHRNSFLFPSTPPRPDDKSPSERNQPLDQTPNPDGIMSHPTKRTTLPLAAFPGFTISQQRDVRGGLIGWLSSQFRFGSDRSIKLEIPVAETYGIPSMIAIGELEQFCSDPNYPNRCTDTTLRTHLSYVTDHAFEPTSSEAGESARKSPSRSRSPAAESKSEREQAPSPGRFKYPVEVVLVNRVYLTRYIDQSTTDSRGAESSIHPQTQDATHAPEPSTQKKELKATSDGKITGATTEFKNDSSQGLRQTFLRPVVIGYRAVRRVPKEEQVQAKSITSSKEIRKCLDDATTEKPTKNCRLALGSEPPPTTNALQPSSKETQQNADDPKRYRLYLHTAGQPEAVIAKARTALRTGGYAIQGEDAQADTDARTLNNGAGVDYFNDADGIGASNVAKLVEGSTSAVVRRRRQTAYNPIGVLGVWLPIASPNPPNVQ